MNCSKASAHNTDRTTRHRHVQLARAIALLLVAKLLDWRNHWSPILKPA